MKYLIFIILLILGACGDLDNLGEEKPESYYLQYNSQKVHCIDGTEKIEDVTIKEKLEFVTDGDKLIIKREDDKAAKLKAQGYTDIKVSEFKGTLKSSKVEAYQTITATKGDEQLKIDISFVGKTSLIDLTGEYEYSVTEGFLNSCTYTAQSDGDKI